MKHINSYLYVLLLAVLHLSAITFKEDFFLFIRVSIFVLFLKQKIVLLLKFRKNEKVSFITCCCSFCYIVLLLWQQSR